MGKSKIIKALESENTIVLKYDGSVVNIQKKKQPKLFKKLSKMISEADEEGLVKEFKKASKAIESYAGKDFKVEHGILTLKGSEEPLPKMIAKKLIEMKDEKVDYQPLINFWNLLKQNPSEESRRELYGFMLHNNIPLTQDGFILVEKGVRQDGNKLVDCHTRRIDNSIGMIVEMPRAKVNANRNQTCSHGLHVAPPDYVRKWYSSDIVIECLVNPADVVSVPVDYNNQKMRVCRYQVTGYAEKSRNKPSIKTYDKILEGAPIPKLDSLPKPQTDKSGDYQVISRQAGLEEVLDKMTAREMNDYTHSQTGKWVLDPKDEKFKTRLKNKKKIKREAIEILVAFQEETERIQKEAEKKIKETKKIESSKKIEAKEKASIGKIENDEVKLTKTEEGGTIDFAGKKAKDIVAQVEVDFGKTIGGKTPRRGRVIQQAIKLYAEKGITVLGA